ncbi:hypothetical protein V8E36_008335 [Tilletia maclaganii]
MSFGVTLIFAWFRTLVDLHQLPSVSSTSDPVTCPSHPCTRAENQHLRSDNDSDQARFHNPSHYSRTTASHCPPSGMSTRSRAIMGDDSVSTAGANATQHHPHQRFSQSR